MFYGNYLWMRPNDSSSGEIDVFEQVGAATGETDTTKIVTQTAHNYGTSKSKKSFNATLPDQSSTSSAFHVYGVEWDANAIKWYIDSPANVTYTVSSSDITWYSDFQKEYYLRLNMSIGGSSSWVGMPNTVTAFPAKYEIDWVRVWQRN